MGRYLEKTFETLMSFWILVSASFFLLRLLPGGPFDHEQALPPALQEKLNTMWGLNRPLLEQYGLYLKSFVQGHLGFSYFQSDISVGQIIFQAFTRTLALNFLAFIFVIIFAFAMAWVCVRFREYPWIKYFNQLIIIMGSLPALFWGPALIYIFCFYWDLLPVAFLNSPKSYILPLLTLCLRPLSQLSRLIKNSWLESLREDFIRTAKAKGLANNRILWFHAVRFSISPLVSWLPSLVISIFAGSVFIELLFSIPGLGMTFVDALNQRDYPVALGATVFYGSLTIFSSWVAEVVRLSLDPRELNEF